MTVPDEAFSMLQNGGLYLVTAFTILVLVFAPLVYIVVLSNGPSQNRLVKIINALTDLVAALRKPNRPSKRLAKSAD